MKGLLDSVGGPANYFNTTLEPMQMLQAYRAGLPVVNHIFRQQQQFLPQGLPSYMPAAAALAQPRFQFGQSQAQGNGMYGGSGPGGDGSPGGVGTDGGADGSGGVGDGGGGGGGGK